MEIYLSLLPDRKCNSGGSPDQERGKFRGAQFSQTIEAEFRKFTNMVFARQAAQRRGISTCEFRSAIMRVSRRLFGFQSILC